MPSLTYQMVDRFPLIVQVDKYTLQIIVARLPRGLLAADNQGETMPLLRLFLVLDKLTMLADDGLSLTDDAVHRITGETEATRCCAYVVYMQYLPLGTLGRSNGPAACPCLACRSGWPIWAESRPEQLCSWTHGSFHLLLQLGMWNKCKNGTGMPIGTFSPTLVVAQALWQVARQCSRGKFCA